MSGPDPGLDPDLARRATGGDAEGDGAGDDADLPADDTLFGVPFRRLLRVRALRGLGLVVLAAALLLWPEPTDRIVGRLVGLGLAVYAAGSAVELVRRRTRRDFLPIVTVGVTAGFAAALVIQPEDSLRSVVQATGGIMLAWTAATLVQLARRRIPTPWGTSRAVALGVGGALLVAFPVTFLTAATAIGAGLLAASGLVQVFTPATDEGEAEEGVPDDAGAGAAVAAWIRRRPDTVEDRATLHEKVFYEGPPSPVRFARFAALMGFAAVIASVGVVVESTAVVIGAMLVAPLMIPLMGTALSLTMGWPRRARRGAGVALTGIGIAVAIGAVVGAVAPRAVDVQANTEIIARTSPTTLDLAIAVAAGAAGAYALSRRDVSDSLPGVAVAIALVPPLTVVGLCWQQGAWSAGNGALLLFLTNATAILVAGGATFVLVGVAPLHRVSESQERLKTVLAALLAGVGVVVVLLTLNGASITRAELAQSDVEDVVTTWAEEHDEFRVLDIRAVDDGTTVVVDLAGPGDPPGLDQLLADIDEQGAKGAEVEVTWTQQERTTVTPGS